MLLLRTWRTLNSTHISHSCLLPVKLKLCITEISHSVTVTTQFISAIAVIGAYIIAWDWPEFEQHFWTQSTFSSFRLIVGPKSPHLIRFQHLDGIPYCIWHQRDEFSCAIRQRIFVVCLFLCSFFFFLFVSSPFTVNYSPAKPLMGDGRPIAIMWNR